MPTPLINVSNRLPVTLSETGEITKSSGGLVAALEGLPKSEYALTWLGWPGKELPADEQARVREALLNEHGASPLFIPQAQADAHYEGFSNSSVWPLLHYMPTRFRYRAEWWDAYRAVNQAFADEVLATAKADEVVWVHDYQLMLLPKLLKDANPRLRVGFFLHTPFPSYEVFRCHPNREDLVAGVLGADLVGFHTFNYVRHFRSCVLRLLGIDSDMLGIRHDGRNTTLGVYPIGINAPAFDRTLDSPEFAEQYGRLARSHEGTRVVLSVERLDYTKGIVERLDAIEHFLDHCPDVEQVKFIFIAVPSRENVEEYRVLREEIEYRVGRVNGRFATLRSSPIHFVHGSVSFRELCALYALADACVVTPLVDGMNLVAKEYIACQREGAAGGAGEAPGVLILSEFAGAAEELYNALIVNPYDPPAVSRAITAALAMPGEERRARMRPMRERVMAHDAATWARDFLEDLSAAAPSSDAAAHAADPTLDAEHRRLARALADGRPVALFLDYDGTLREIVRDPAAAAPTPEVRALLDRLAATANADVTIISGRTPDDLDRFLRDCPRFALIAEHGASLRRPGVAEWEHLDRNLSYDWKEPVLKILRLFESSTPGTFVEDKRTSLVWHYRRADPEFGEYKARQLLMELSAVTANAPVTVRQGRKIVEVTSSQINKGAAVTALLAERTYDVIVVAGDDTTDETMFRLAPPAGAPDPFLTIKIGDGETAARHRLATPAALRRFLLGALPVR